MESKKSPARWKRADDSRCLDSLRKSVCRVDGTGEKWQLESSLIKVRFFVSSSTTWSTTTENTCGCLEEVPHLRESFCSLSVVVLAREEPARRGRKPRPALRVQNLPLVCKLRICQIDETTLVIPTTAIKVEPKPLRLHFSPAIDHILFSAVRRSNSYPSRRIAGDPDMSSS